MTKTRKELRMFFLNERYLQSYWLKCAAKYRRAAVRATQKACVLEAQAAEIEAVLRNPPARAAKARVKEKARK